MVRDARGGRPMDTGASRDVGNLGPRPTQPNPSASPSLSQAESDAPLLERRAGRGPRSGQRPAPNPPRCHVRDVLRRPTQNRN